MKTKPPKRQQDEDLPVMLGMAEGILTELEGFPTAIGRNDPIEYRPTTRAQSETLQSIQKSQDDLHEHLLERQQEPFYALVRCEDDGEERVFLICRGFTPNKAPVRSGATFVNYHAPVGKVASAKIGSLVDYPKGKLRFSENVQVFVWMVEEEDLPLEHRRQWIPVDCLKV